MTKKVATTPYHPRQCHLCKYNGVNVRRVADGMPLDEEAAAACRSCKAVDMKDVHDGVSWVSLDAAACADTVTHTRIAPDYQPNRPMPHVEKISGAAREGVLDLIRRFSEIPYGSADVICGMLAGKTLADMVKEQKKPMQNLHAAWKRAIAKDPIWKTLENGMIGKGVGHKKKTFDQEMNDEPQQMEFL